MSAFDTLKTWEKALTFRLCGKPNISISDFPDFSLFPDRQPAAFYVGESEQKQAFFELGIVIGTSVFKAVSEAMRLGGNPKSVLLGVWKECSKIPLPQGKEITAGVMFVAEIVREMSESKRYFFYTFLSFLSDDDFHTEAMKALNRKSAFRALFHIPHAVSQMEVQA